MNKEYLKWLREVAEEQFFIDFGSLNFALLRKLFLNQFTPSDAAFMFVPW